MQRGIVAAMLQPEPSRPLESLRTLVVTTWARLYPFAGRALLALLWRYGCYIVMIALSLWAEDRPAPHLPDLLIDHLPYLAWVDRYNHLLLAAVYLPLAALLLLHDPARFCRYNVTTGVLSLIRGLCIAATGLGPVYGPDSHAGLLLSDAGRHSQLFTRALLELCSPFGLLSRDAPHVYLNKDLFFSGHTGVTFLLLLYVWPHRRLRWPALLGHALVVVSVLLSHLHYTIDLVGAYAVALALYAVREGWPIPARPR